MLGFLVVLPTFVVWELHPAIWISGPVLLFVGVMLKWLVGISDQGVSIQQLADANRLRRTVDQSAIVLESRLRPGPRRAVPAVLRISPASANIS